MPAPRRQVRTTAGATIIELSIPVRRRRRLVSDASDTSDADTDTDDDEEMTCYICANSFCDDETSCCRALTHLGCCTQAICCGCLLKSCKRCTCKDECDAVISLCPFCREVSSVDALDVFLGSKGACAACKAADDRLRPMPASPAASPVATSPSPLPIARDVLQTALQAPLQAPSHAPAQAPADS